MKRNQDVGGSLTLKELKRHDNDFDMPIFVELKNDFSMTQSGWTLNNKKFGSSCFLRMRAKIVETHVQHNIGNESMGKTVNTNEMQIKVKKRKQIVNIENEL